MSETGFPPPKPPTGRSLEFEKEKQAEFYALEEAGKLPVDSEGKSLDFVGFMELAEKERKAPEPMVREELSGGASVRIAKHAGLTPSHRGGKTSKKPATKKKPAMESSSNTVDSSVVEGIERLHAAHVATDDRSRELHSRFELLKGANASAGAVSALEGYETAKRQADALRSKAEEALRQAENEPAEATMQAAAASVARAQLAFTEELQAAEAALTALESAPVKDPATEPFTPKEQHEALRAALDKPEDVSKPSTAPEERAQVQAKEAEYLLAYKELEQKRRIWNRLFPNKELKAETERVESLKGEYDALRVAYANALTGNVSERVAERDANFEEYTRQKYDTLVASDSIARNADGTVMSFETFFKRAEARAYSTQDRVSSYLTYRNVIRPLTEKKLAAREEALNSRGKNAFEKGLAWSGRLNGALVEKHGKWGARAIQAAGGIAVVSLGAGVLGAAGVIAPLGLTALAMGGGIKFARSMAGALVGAAAGEGAGALFELFGRKAQEKAKLSLRKAGKNMDVSDGLTLEALQAMDQKREKLTVDSSEMAFQRRKVLIKALTAMGFGAGSAALLADLSVVQDAADAVHTGNGAEAGVKVEEVPARDAVPAPSAEVAYVTPTVPEGMLRTVEIEQGEGFNHLFTGLRESGFNGSTPVGNYLLNGELAPTQLSDAIGAFDPVTGESMIMEVGDKLVVDAKENVWFVREGEAPRLILENNPSAPNGVAVHEFPPRAAAPVVPSPEVAPSAPVLEPVVSEAATPDAVPVEPSEVRVVPVDRSFEHQSIDPVVVPEAQSLEVPAQEATPSPVSVEPQPQVADTVSVEPELVRTETVPTNTPETVSGNINAYGVDLSKPDVSLADGKYFAHGGADNDANYALAIEYAERIGRTQPNTPVYYIEENMTVLGGLERIVRGVVFDPNSNDGAGMVVPYTVRGGIEIPVPPVPGPEDYQPIPTSR